LVPVRGEVNRIERCLDAVLAQDWPADRLEIIVVDGAPDDGTATAAERVLATRSEVRSEVVANPGGGRGANLNRGLHEASGSIVCRVDARSALPPGYIAACVEVLQDPTVAVVGGAQVAVAPETGAKAAGIGRGLNNRLAMGMARYRRATGSGPTDTVYLGAFRRSELDAAGGWDESLEINEDFDLNRRMIAFGTVWFDSRLAVSYLARDSVAAVGRQYWTFGRWKVRYLRRRREGPRLRQAVGLAVLPGLALVLIAVGRRPRRLRVPLLLAASGATLAAEALGASPGGASPTLRTRAWSVITCATVVASWSAGAWWELVTGERNADG
jgi:glycosyltransferase involved in cell wall biosynthesis